MKAKNVGNKITFSNQFRFLRIGHLWNDERPMKPSHAARLAFGDFDGHCAVEIKRGPHFLTTLGWRVLSTIVPRTMVLGSVGKFKVCGQNLCLPDASMHPPEYFRDNIRHLFWRHGRQLQAESDHQLLWRPHHHHDLSSSGQPKVQIFS